MIIVKNLPLVNSDNTYHRRRINLQLVSSLTGVASLALMHSNNKQHFFKLGKIKSSQTGDLSCSDTFTDFVSGSINCKVSIL